MQKPDDKLESGEINSPGEHVICYDADGNLVGVGAYTKEDPEIAAKIKAMIAAEDAEFKEPDFEVWKAALDSAFEEGGYDSEDVFFGEPSIATGENYIE